MAKLYFGAVARRIEIELTSARPDGTWTWRAAGALNPRGALDGNLLYGGAKAGDVVRAEVDFGIEGITVISIEPPRPPEEEDPNRIKLLDKPAVASVTTQLASHGRGERQSGERDARRPPAAGESAARGPLSGPAGPRGDGTARGPRRPAGEPGRAAGERARSERPDRPDRGHRPGLAPSGRRDGSRTNRGTGASGGPYTGGAELSQASQRPGRGALRPRARESAEPREGRDARESAARDRTSPRQHRLNPGNAHRNAMLESLPTEQRPIAQQLLRGGIPAVRTALHFERERAREEGRPEPSAEGVLAIAESLVSRVKAAEWRDRAEAAIKAGDDLAMRDLRSLVSGSDTARDDASRGFVITLRELLERRVEAHRKLWEDEVAKHLGEGHVLRALRLSARPPDAGARFSSELASRLRDAASAALAPSLGPERWLALLEAIAESPVRRTVKPEGLPPAATAELLQAARQQCGRVPALAPLLGLAVPPPPGPARPVPVARVPGGALGRRPRLTSAPRKPARRPAQRERPAPADAQAPAGTSAKRATTPLVQASAPVDVGTAPPLDAGMPAPEVATPRSDGGPVEGELVEGGTVEGSPVEGELVEGSPVEGGPVEGELVEDGAVEVAGAPGPREAPAEPGAREPTGEGKALGPAPHPGEADV